MSNADAAPDWFGWHTAMPSGRGMAAVAAWRAVDVWDNEEVLLIDYDGPHPHTLMARDLKPGGLMIDKVGILEIGAAAQWDRLREADEAPIAERLARRLLP
ncbi:hypothetical protein ACBJ59_14150 [Nonomuraea sp. MTCD27]|uniref:hypothetical protein n=1 Tax=Nonomuraea sp. MTCD27 TaxID=1676747 RepID=UPI0035BF975B